MTILLKSLAIDLGGESNSPRQGLQRLLLLRTFVTVAGVIGLLIFLSFRELNIPIRFIIYLVLIILTSIFASYWRLKASRLVSYGELFSHILLDVAFLIILLLNTGGIGNPLISYLLVLLAVSATLLPRAFVNTFAIGSILLYTFFLFLELSAEAEMSNGGNNGETTFQLHLVGMWVIFLVSAILISVFITRMASAIQVRELNLAEARETEMRNEQLVAIGTLAAGTAHALGTPLSTMAVLLTELDELSPKELKDNDIKGDISILKQQVIRCKHSLTQLTRYYNKDNTEKEETQLLPKFVNDIQDYIINIHPTASVNFLIENAQDLKVASSLSIRHALINIIENGIKASKTHVEVKFKITQAATTYFEVAVKDDGPGIPTKIMEKMGEPFISIRKESMGLGIFLANAAIQRLHGSIEMFNLKSGGALTLIKLPMSNSRSL
jgi:two-component system sensor histidine kinase RegB